MVEVSIVNETSPEANWDRRAGRQTDRHLQKLSPTVLEARLRLPSFLEGDLGNSAWDSY